MDRKASHWLATVIGGLAVLLAIADIGLGVWNSSVKSQIDQRQMVINTGAEQRLLTENIAQALSDAAEEHNEKRIREMLTAEGVQDAIATRKTNGNVSGH